MDIRVVVIAVYGGGEGVPIRVDTIDAVAVLVDTVSGNIYGPRMDSRVVVVAV